MTIRACSLLLALTFSLSALPARAQGPGGPPPNYQQLVAQVTDLRARVAKLEGNITAADMVGTYTIAGIQTRLQGGGANTLIGSAALTGSMTLNADGTGSMTISGDGSVLSVLGWTLTPSTLGNGNPGAP